MISTRIAQLTTDYPRRGYIAIVSFVLLRAVLMALPQLVHAIALGRAVGFETGLLTAVGALRPALPMIIAIFVAAWLFAMRLGKADHTDEQGSDLAAYGAVPFLVAQSIAAPLGRIVTIPTTLQLIVGGLLTAIGALVAFNASTQLRTPSPSPSQSQSQFPSRAAALALLLLLTNAYPALHELATHAADLSRIEVHTNAPAPDFTLAALDGAPVHLAALKGRPVLLMFWATWCPVCKQELPTIEALAKAPNAPLIYAISTDDTRQTLAAFRQSTGMQLPILLDDGATSQRYSVSSIPSLVLIAADGTVKKTFVGLTRQSALEDAIASLQN